MCIVVTLVAKVADLGVPQVTPVPTPVATVTAEIGVLRVDAAGTFAENAVALARVNDLPDPALFNQSVGGLVTTTYNKQQDVCVDGSCQFVLGIVDLDQSTLKVGELWSARLQVWVGSIKVMDQPFAAVLLTEEPS